MSTATACRAGAIPPAPLVGGDALCLSIAAASIVAKHVRDQIMIAHHETWPHYGWHTNKGYSAPAHLRALREHGPTPLHRRSFAPVAQLILPLGETLTAPILEPAT